MKASFILVRKHVSYQYESLLHTGMTHCVLGNALSVRGSIPGAFQALPGWLSRGYPPREPS